MQNEELLDDYQFEPQAESDIELVTASTGQRLVNYIVDNIVVRLLLFLFVSIVDQTQFLARAADDFLLLFILAIIGLLIGYYWVGEFVWGRTVGKLLTGTKVVTDEGYRPSALSVLGRTFARIVPFEAFSIFFDSDRLMWHDTWAGTMVVDVNKSVLPSEE
jgi:uncharacterized RDD family membrane protein YckC